MELRFTQESIENQVRSACLKKLERYERVVETIKGDLPIVQKQVTDFLVTVQENFELKNWLLHESSSDQWLILLIVKRPELSITEGYYRNEIQRFANHSGVQKFATDGPSYQIHVIFEYN